MVDKPNEPKRLLLNNIRYRTIVYNYKIGNKQITIRCYYRFSFLDTLAMKKYKPTDATTNPSLILQASQKAEYAKLIDDAVDYAKDKGG